MLSAFEERVKEFNGLTRGRARSEARSMQATPYPGSTTGESGSRPKWLVLAASEVAAAGLFSFAESPRTALYWYIFPLFGLTVSVQDNLVIGGIFTGVSLIRSFLLRRLFENFVAR